MSPAGYPSVRSFRSCTVPGVEYFDSHVIKVPNVARRHRHAARPSNRCDLAIGLRDRTAPLTPCGGDPGIASRLATSLGRRLAFSDVDGQAS